MILPDSTNLKYCNLVHVFLLQVTQNSNTLMHYRVQKVMGYSTGYFIK